MGLFGKSFEEKVKDAVATLRGQEPTVKDLDARVEGKSVTLTGHAGSRDAKARVMEAFNKLVETENTFNQIRVAEPVAAPGPTAAKVSPTLASTAPAAAAGAAPAAAAARMHEVVSGDTLGAIAKKYYGKSNLYPKIFEANRDQLSDPDKIKVGQKLRIPE